MRTVSISTKKINDVLIIGGGASGMMAALFACRGGARVTVLERNEKLGKKLYITGKGRCNATNACDTQEFLQNVPCNPRFLYAALDFFSPDDLRALLAENGCDTKVERGNRVFPVSDHASDVIRALSRGNYAARLRCEVKELLVEDSKVAGVVLASGAVMRADSVIIATGGASYPATGSTGDGYRLAVQAGHTVVPPSPSLVPLCTHDDWVKSLQGLSLKNVCLSCMLHGKMIYSEMGEMLFTHFGVSGPLAIELSSHLPESAAPDADVRLDMKPALSHEQLSERLRRDFAQNGKKRLASVLPGLLPARMAALFPALCGVSGETLCSQVTQEERARIAQTLKSIPLPLSGFRPLAEAIVTRGGVNVREVDPKTMRSKLLPGLYFAGEVLDVDAHTGGFNLQIAFSTGALAGARAAEEEW